MNRNNILRIISVIVYIILVVVIVPFPLGDDIDTLGKLLRPYELVFIGSIIIGTTAGISGLKIFRDASNKVHTFIREEKESTDSNIISAIEAPMRISDQLESERLRTGIKIATLILVPFIIVYTMYIIVCMLFVILLMLIIIAAIIGFVSSMLGIELPRLPSFGGGGGGGSSSGSGGGISSSSSGAIFGSSYEETAKEESRPFKVDKETKSSEGALPFGLGGDTIYKTEYEDTSTGETVKGHGWTSVESTFKCQIMKA